MNQEVVQLSVDEIAEPEQDIRSVITREYLDELSDSIRRVGVLQPIIVVEKNGKYEIVAGHRRYLAARQAGLLHIPCLIQDFHSEMIDLAKVHENLFREDISPIDEAKYYHMLTKKYQYPLDKIASMVSRSVPYIQGRLDILAWPPDLLEALDTGMITLSVGKEFAHITDDEKRKYFLSIAAQNGITAETARQWRYQFEIERGTRAPVTNDPGNPGGLSTPVPLKVSCQGCLGTVDITHSRVLYLCSECHQKIVAIIEGTQGA